MKRQPITQVILSLLWGVPIGLFLPTYLGLRASLWLDQIFNLPKLFADPANLVIGVVLVLAFLPLYISSAYYLIKYGGGSPNPYHASPLNLVRTGPYKYIRHPMNITYPFFILGLATSLNSFSAIFILTPVSGLLFWFHAMVLQEKELVKKFEREYEEYKKETPAFIPNLRKR